MWCDENGLILTCKNTTDLPKMASIQWSFIKSKSGDNQQLIKQNGHFGVICCLGLPITSKKKRIFAVEDTKYLTLKRNSTKRFVALKLKI